MTRQEFDNFIKQQSRKLYGFAYGILRNREETEDVVQEIFIRLWKMGDKLDQYNSLEALATTMTRNYCIDLIRKQKHLVSNESDMNNYQNQLSPSPQELLEKTESGNLLRSIIRDLPAAYRQIIELRDINGESFEEIASITKQNINSIRVILSRARKMIRDEYNKYHYERRGIESTHRKVL
jgi:RNA polymerase sigma-70 factor (ECF subfamily)